jgi:hypothetical protein
MKVISCYIELDKLKSGTIPQFIYADVELDMDREDGKMMIVRIPLPPYDTYFKAKGRSYSQVSDLQQMTRSDFIPMIKQQIGEIVANELFEDEEALINLGK